MFTILNIMDNQVIDLRSDTITIPTPGMIASIKKASFGDSFYDEDRASKELENIASQILGFESAAFLISGTLANILSIKVTVNYTQNATDQRFSFNHAKDIWSEAAYRLIAA